MLDKIYLEITNVCNLDCTFCHKTKREKKLMSEEEFAEILEKIRGKAKYLYMHLMGEPTLHPSLSQFVKKARENGFLPAITTNGSLLHKSGADLIAAHPYKVSVSLHAKDANPAFGADGYLESCVDFAKRAAESGTFVALRLWNLGTDADNSAVLSYLHAAFPGEWRDLRGGSSHRLCERVFLEWGEHFDWPDTEAPECDAAADMFCYGLRDQIGILVDGTVVPCCLDADANLALGNIHNTDLDAILTSERARKIYDGFTRRRAIESFCRKCGYARRFSK